jgi:PAS domain S-box-containing protein
MWGRLPVWRVLRSLAIATSSVLVVTVAFERARGWGMDLPAGVFVLPVLLAALLGDELAIAFTVVLTLLDVNYRLILGTNILGLPPSEHLRLLIFILVSGLAAAAVRRLRAGEHQSRATAEELRTAEGRLEQALGAAKMVAWTWDRRTGVIRYTPASGAAITPGPSPTPGDAAGIHDADRTGHEAVIRAALAANTGYQSSFRVARPAGETEMWIRQHATPLRDAAGAIVGFTGVDVDVSAQHELEVGLRAREEQLQILIDAVPALISYVDADRRYRFVNRSYEEWFGCSREQLVGQHMSTVLGEQAYEDARVHLAAAERGEQVRFESLLMHRDGGPRLVQATYVPDQAHNGFFALVIDVTSDRHREQALRDAEHAARVANELKDQFLATLSHELRTPLNVILGYAQMSQSGAVGPEHALGVIERNAQLQARLVEDLLDVSRIASGKFRFSTDRVPIGPVVTDAVAMLRPSASAKSIQVEVTVEDPGLAVLGDASRLRQLLANLVHNAVKFTNRNGRVSIAARRDGGDLVLEVRDSGIGIAPDFLPFVFDQFRQADSSTTREHGGLGLGLTIASGIVEAHGGRMSVQSGGPNLGSTFTVRLPLAPDPAADEAATRNAVGRAQHEPS